jgi:hypothetical protein
MRMYVCVCVCVCASAGGSRPPPFGPVAHTSETDQSGVSRRDLRARGIDRLDGDGRTRDRHVDVMLSAASSSGCLSNDNTICQPKSQMPICFFNAVLNLSSATRRVIERNRVNAVWRPQAICKQRATITYCLNLNTAFDASSQESGRWRYLHGFSRKRLRVIGRKYDEINDT